MDKCVTCGRELHPERAKKYNYCMSPECQEKNAKGLTMVAVGVNKAAEQYMILDENTKDEIASGKYHDQRRGSFGTTVTPSAPSPAPPSAAPRPHPAVPPQRPAAPAAPAAPKVTRKPWSQRQQRLALLYNEQGLRPDEIAEKIGLSRYLVTQIILNTSTRGKL
jgi:type IV secretory pathway VirB10-like protein